MFPSDRPDRPVTSSVASSRRWIRHFRANAQVLLTIPWQVGPTLTTAERQAVLRSVQEFQQGEGLEGANFFRRVRTYGASSGDHEYVEAHRLFMAEEKRHAHDLGRFLRLEGLEPLERCSPRNWLFRWCGSRASLEHTLTVIVLVEVMALVYYRALLAATGSQVLRRLCVQILCDETHHVRFHCDRLGLLRRRRSGWLARLTDALDDLLFCGAVLVCWWGHARALRAGGYSLVRFWRAARGKFRRARTWIRTPGPGLALPRKLAESAASA